MSRRSAVPQLFDTNILIDHLNGIAKATREIKASPNPAISTITWIEVMTGAADLAEESILRSFLANFTVLPVSDTVSERAVEIRRRMRVKLPDAIILATAQVAGRELCTRNIRDFPAEMGGVRVPYRV